MAMRIMEIESNTEIVVAMCVSQWGLASRKEPRVHGEGQVDWILVQYLRATHVVGGETKLSGCNLQP